MAVVAADVAEVMVDMAVGVDMATQTTTAMDHEVVGEIAGKGLLDCSIVYSLLHWDAFPCNFVHYFTLINLRCA